MPYIARFPGRPGVHLLRTYQVTPQVPGICRSATHWRIFAIQSRCGPANLSTEWSVTISSQRNPEYGRPSASDIEAGREYAFHTHRPKGSTFSFGVQSGLASRQNKVCWIDSSIVWPPCFANGRDRSNVLVAISMFYTTGHAIRYRITRWYSQIASRYAVAKKRP